MTDTTDLEEIAAARAAAPEQESDRAGRRRRVAEKLYDELTGRHTADQSAPNAVLADVTFNVANPTERDRRIQLLHLEAASLGLEVHRQSGDRWALAQRLADCTLEVLDSPA